MVMAWRSSSGPSHGYCGFAAADSPASRGLRVGAGYSLGEKATSANLTGARAALRFQIRRVFWTYRFMLDAVLLHSLKITERVILFIAEKSMFNPLDSIVK